MTLSSGPLPVRGSLRKTPATRFDQRPGEMDGEQHGDEGDAAAAGSAHSSTGISMTRPRTRSGAWAATRRLTFPPRETPPTTAWSMSRWSSRATTWSRVGVHPVERCPHGTLGQAVAGQVEQDHPVPPGGEVDGQAAVEVGVEQDPVQEDQDARALPVDLVVELEALGLEHADLVGDGLLPRAGTGRPHSGRPPRRVCRFSPPCRHGVHGTPRVAGSPAPAARPALW